MIVKDVGCRTSLINFHNFIVYLYDNTICKIFGKRPKYFMILVYYINQYVVCIVSFSLR